MKVDPFAEAISEGDGHMNVIRESTPTDEAQMLATIALAYYQKATAIATWKAAGRVHLIESVALEAAEASSER